MFRQIFIRMLFVFIGFTSLSFAQEKMEQEEFSNRLQFYLINGLNIAYTDQSSSFSLRYSANIEGNYHKNDNNSSQSNYNTSDTSKSEQKNKNENFGYNINTKIQYMIPLYQKESISSYFGIGPTLFYGRSFYNNVNEYENDSSENIDKNVRDRWSNNYGIGLSSVLGLEAKLADHVALFAEYDLNFSYGWTDSKRKNRYENSSSKNNGDATGYHINLNRVKIGASVYF